MRRPGARCIGLLPTALAAGLLTAPAAWAQPTPVAKPDALKLSGSVRLRYEAIDGQVRPGFNASDQLVSLRTTLLGEAAAGPLRFGAELYDSRAYGGDAGTPVSTSEVNALELVQAYAALDLDAPFGAGTRASVQAGRFTLNLGSRRLVAADDFRNTTNGYTGVRADLTLPQRVRATLIYTLPQQRRPDELPALLDNEVRTDREGDDLALWGGIVSRAKAVGPALAEASYFHLEESDEPGRPTRDRSLDTVAARLLVEPAPGRLDGEVEVLRQGGEVSAGLAPGAPQLDVEASAFHADVGYTFDRPAKPRVALELDYASGDDEGAAFGRFDTLFGMRRADIAPSGLYNTVGRANLLAPGVRVEAAPSKRLDLFATYKPLWLASETDSFSTSGVRDAAGASGRFAGHQLDARARYWLVPDRVRLEANGVYLAKGRFLERAPNAPRSGDTAYVSLNLLTTF